MAYPLSTPIDELADIALQSDDDLEMLRADIVAEQVKRKIDKDATATLNDVQTHLNTLANLTDLVTLEKDTQDGIFVIIDFAVEGQSAANKRWLNARVECITESGKPSELLVKATGRMRTRKDIAKVLLTTLNDDLN